MTEAGMRLSELNTSFIVLLTFFVFHLWASNRLNIAPTPPHTLFSSGLYRTRSVFDSLSLCQGKQVLKNG